MYNGTESEVIASYEGQYKSGRLTLWFVHEGQLELERALFQSPLLPDEIVAVRGKTTGAFRLGVTFQWTTGVQGLAVLMLKAAGKAGMGRLINEPLLAGGKGSLAAALDAGISKEAAWLDLFGGGIEGRPLAKALFKRTNPGRKRPGPVMISLNERLLPAAAITIHLDDRAVKDPYELLQYGQEIETRGTENGRSIRLCNTPRCAA